MRRTNTLFIVIMLTSVIFSGCSTSQEKSSLEDKNSAPNINVAGKYDFKEIITESDCVKGGVGMYNNVHSNTEITQNGSILKWSVFGLGAMEIHNEESSIVGSQAQFRDRWTMIHGYQVHWNATIDFSESGFSGTGDFAVTGEWNCKGVFELTGTSIE